LWPSTLIVSVSPSATRVTKAHLAQKYIDWRARLMQINSAAFRFPQAMPDAVGYGSSFS
jgi:hypothetical protein